MKTQRMVPAIARCFRPQSGYDRGLRVQSVEHDRFPWKLFAYSPGEITKPVDPCQSSTLKNMHVLGKSSTCLCSAQVTSGIPEVIRLPNCQFRTSVWTSFDLICRFRYDVARLVRQQQMSAQAVKAGNAALQKARAPLPHFMS